MKKYRLFRFRIVLFFAACSLAANAQSQPQKINITHFYVVKSQNKVRVNWSTENKVATNYFEVEKGEDGKNFRTVAYVLGADPSKSNHDGYECFDKINTFKKESYYRLKHVNVDGDFEFSAVRMLTLNN